MLMISEALAKNKFLRIGDTKFRRHVGCQRNDLFPENLIWRAYRRNRARFEYVCRFVYQNEHMAGVLLLGHILMILPSGSAN